MKKWPLNITRLGINYYKLTYINLIIHSDKWGPNYSLFVKLRGNCAN